MNDDCSCGLNGSQEDTSSLEPDFQAVNVTNMVGHRNSAQESAIMAFDTLGLKRKDDGKEEKLD